MNGRSPIAASLLLTLSVAAVFLGARVHRAAPRTSFPTPATIHARTTLAPAAAPEPSNGPDAPAASDSIATSENAASSGSTASAASVNGACPGEMVPVEGSHCFYWEQPCVRWDDPEGQPAKRVCGEFQQPSVCKSARHAMRFCMDRDEYIAPGETVPARAVSWTQADMVCASQGKRLCTSVEWEFACEGEEGVPYPYGYARSSALCNQDRLLRDGKYKASADLREPPHPTCASPFGVLDMVGNVDEWVRMPGAKAPRRSELRGGWWMTGRNRCRANTSHHDEKYAGPQTGFRCCRDLGAPSAKAASAAPRTAMVAPGSIPE